MFSSKKKITLYNVTIFENPVFCLAQWQNSIASAFGSSPELGGCTSQGTSAVRNVAGVKEVRGTDATTGEMPLGNEA